MAKRATSGHDVDTEAVGEYLETLGKALQHGDALVYDVHEDRDVPDPDEELEIRFGITFTPCHGVDLPTGVPYTTDEPDG